LCLALFPIVSHADGGKGLEPVLAEELPFTLEKGEENSSPALARDDMGFLAASQGLNEREGAILALMLEGRTLSRIGETLGLSTSGIKYHARSLYGKLGVNSREELISLVATDRQEQGITPGGITPGGLRFMGEQTAESPARSLTAREQQVAYLLAHGKTIEAIARELIISTNTAKSHVRTIYTKLGVHSKQELIDLLR
jgi:DNA-binding CsgD family transcriptional regulator